MKERNKLFLFAFINQKQSGAMKDTLIVNKHIMNFTKLLFTAKQCRLFVPYTNQT